MAKRKIKPKKKEQPKDELREQIEAFTALLETNHFKVIYATSGFYKTGYWDFSKGEVRGRIVYDKMFMCDSRITADIKTVSVLKHSKVFTTVPGNNEERKELITALYDLQFVGDDFSFREYSKDVL